MDVIYNDKYGVQLFPDVLETLLLIFTDDVILESDVASGIQKQLNILECYADIWGLTVNPEKTNIVVFRRGGFYGEMKNGFMKVKVNGRGDYLQIRVDG